MRRRDQLEALSGRRGGPAGSPAGGFSLVELLVVIGVIVLLVAITVPALMKARATAMRGQSQATVTNISAAIGNYKSELDQYPESRVFKRPEDMAPGVTYWNNDNNHRYRNLMGAELLTLALAGNDDEIIPNRPALNPPVGSTTNAYSMVADLHKGLGFKIRAELALVPNRNPPPQTRALTNADGTAQIAGRVFGYYMKPDDFVKTKDVIDVGTRAEYAETGNPAPPPRRVLVDAYGSPILYYRAYHYQYPTLANQVLAEAENALAGMNQRDTGLNRTNPSQPFASTLLFGGRYYPAPIFDLDHNFDLLNGTSLSTSKSYKAEWGSTATDALRRWISGWDSTSSNNGQYQAKAGFDQVNPLQLATQGFLLISPAADGVYGRATKDDTSADDIVNFPTRKE